MRSGPHGPFPHIRVQHVGAEARTQLPHAPRQLVPRIGRRALRPYPVRVNAIKECDARAARRRERARGRGGAEREPRLQGAFATPLRTAGGPWLRHRDRRIALLHAAPAHRPPWRRRGGVAAARRTLETAAPRAAGGARGLSCGEQQRRQMMTQRRLGRRASRNDEFWRRRSAGWRAAATAS